MKKILIINSGSSSLKFQLFETDGKKYNVVIKGLAERIGIEGSQIYYHYNEQKYTTNIVLDNHKTTLKAILDILLKTALTSIDQLWAVGHRLGHGGEYFDKSVIIDNDVMQKIYETKDLLPLHGNAFIYGIEAMKSLLPEVKQVATFDSAFHQTMPKEAYLYALPYEQYEKYKIRRYGFHGTSHYFVSNELLKVMPNANKIISCHLGSGASITAIKNGKSIDTSFGFAASCGITMGTRCGDIDAYIPLYIMQTQNKTIEQVNQMMNKECGLYALSGGFSDTRDIEAKYLQGDEKAITTVNIYVHNIIKYIGAYTAEMGGVDAIIFTAGIGENSAFLRKKICERLQFMGIKINDENNKKRSQFVEISANDSKIKVYVIPTNEELVIAQDTFNLCKLTI